MYTVIDAAGIAIDRHLTAAEAAQIILRHDGAEYEIRGGQECGGILAGERFFDLWTRRQLANKPWTKTVVSAIAATEAGAEAKIFAEVIAANWPQHPEAVTDAQYDEMMASADD